MSPELAGVDWIVIALGSQPVPDDAGAVLRFGEDGRVTGSTGINQLAGDYELADGILSVGPLALTRMAGEPEAMEREGMLVALLAGPVAVTAEHEGVRLGDSAGILIRPA